MNLVKRCIGRGKRRTERDGRGMGKGKLKMMRKENNKQGELSPGDGDRGGKEFKKEKKGAEEELKA